MGEFFTQYGTSIFIGCMLGILFSLNSSRKRDIASLECKIDYIKREIPCKFEHNGLCTRVRNLEEEVRVLHLIIKKKINQD